MYTLLPQITTEGSGQGAEGTSNVPGELVNQTDTSTGAGEEVEEGELDGGECVCVPNVCVHGCVPNMCVCLMCVCVPNVCDTVLCS